MFLSKVDTIRKSNERNYFDLEKILEQEKKKLYYSKGEKKCLLHIFSVIVHKLLQTPEQEKGKC